MSNAIDREDMCMHDSGCERRATRFENGGAHWHDLIWCDEHAAGRGTMPLHDALYTLDGECPSMLAQISPSWRRK